MNDYSHSNKIICPQEMQLMRDKLPHELAIIKLNRDQITNLQEIRLREMLAYAKKHSSWYAERLRHIDPKNFKLTDLQQLPIMTKNDLMTNWNDIVTNKKLKYAEASAFLMQQSDFELLHGCHLFASGGSSGRRGLFVWDPNELATILSAWYRYQYRDEFSGANEQDHRLAVSIASVKPVHLGPALFAAAILSSMQTQALSAATAIDELVAQLNQWQPTYLNGYPSVITRLASQAIKGNLSITPRRMLLGSEPLLTRMINIIKQAWPDILITNIWGATDTGAHAESCDYSENHLHINEDLVIIEPVDSNNNLVAANQKTSKVLVTNLHRQSMPVFRYEIDDCIVVSDKMCACGSNFKLIKSISGRHEENFIYSHIVVVPDVVEDIIMPEAGIDEYQVFQTKTGVKILLVPEKHATINAEKIQYNLTLKLQQLGLKDPSVEINIIHELFRHPETNKLKRFHKL